MEIKHKLSEFIPEIGRLKESLETYNLVVVVGEIGTGKTGIIGDYFSNTDFSIINVDKTTNSRTIVSCLRNTGLFRIPTVVIYDDITIKKDLLESVAKFIHPTKSQNKFVVLINKIKSIPKKYIKHELKHPKLTELRTFFKANNITNKQLIKKILDLKTKSMRRIEFTLLDEYYSGLDESEKKERFHLTKMGSYMFSLGIAENLSRFKKFDDLLVEADKLKNINDNFYLDFIKCYYPSIESVRLRYPKRLYNIIQKQKGVDVNG